MKAPEMLQESLPGFEPAPAPEAVLVAPIPEIEYTFITDLQEALAAIVKLKGA